MALQINMNFFERVISSGGITSVWWVQLSTAIISGLAFSTLLTLVMIPSLLAMPANIVAPFKWVASKVRRSKTDESEVAEAVAEEVSLDDLNEMMRTARVAKPVAKPVAEKPAKKRTRKTAAKATTSTKTSKKAVRHAEDSSVVQMPKKVKKEQDNDPLPAAAE
jgi:multidrug efflux pump